MSALALDTARQLRVPLPSAAVADELLTVARGLGYERRDLAALFEVLAQLAGEPSWAWLTSPERQWRVRNLCDGEMARPAQVAARQSSAIVVAPLLCCDEVGLVGARARFLRDLGLKLSAEIGRQASLEEAQRLTDPSRA
jgi:hypothetical protein